MSRRNAVVKAIRQYFQGVTTKGTCMDCGHGATASAGCRCMAAWCPCHRAAYGHGAHGCRSGEH